MSPILEDQCQNLEFFLTRDPTSVTYKLGQNQVPADVYFPWIRTKREWVQCVPDPQQHVVFHGFDGRGHRSVSKSQNLTEASTAHIHMDPCYRPASFLACCTSLFDLCIIPSVPCFLYGLVIIYIIITRTIYYLSCKPSLFI